MNRKCIYTVITIFQADAIWDIIKRELRKEIYKQTHRRSGKRWKKEAVCFRASNTSSAFNFPANSLFFKWIESWLSRGRVPRLTSDIFTCCHTGTESWDHDFCLSRSHCNHTGPNSEKRAPGTRFEPVVPWWEIAGSTDWVKANANITPFTTQFFYPRINKKWYTAKKKRDRKEEKRENLVTFRRIAKVK